MALSNTTDYQNAFKYFMHYVHLVHGVNFGVIQADGEQAPDASVVEQIKRYGWPPVSGTNDDTNKIADISTLISDYLDYKVTREAVATGYDGTAGAVDDNHSTGF